MHSKIKSITVKKLFWMITLIGLLLALFSILLSRGYHWRFLLWEGDTAGIFPDLFESIGDGVSKNPYERGAIYPALAYLFCYALGKCIPGFDSTYWFDMSTTRAATVVAALFYFFCVLALIWVMDKSFAQDRGTQRLVTILFICSAPFLFMLERGNMVILSLVCCMFFVCYYDSEVPCLRHFSYIALALAASLKVYPAVLGLLIIKEKKLRNVIYLICYGVAIFVLPFFFFGGLKDIWAMLSNAFLVSNETLTSTRGFGYGYKVNIQNLFMLIADCTGGNWDIGVHIIVILTVVLLVVASFMCKEKWKRVACLSLLLVIIPTFSWIYNAIYMLPAFVLFLNKNGEDRDYKSFVFLVLFMGIYMPLPYGEFFTQLEGANKMSLSTIVCSASSYILAILLICDSAMVLASKRFRLKDNVSVEIYNTKG